MDAYSGKRAIGWVNALRKKSTSINGAKDEPVQFCNRLGCSGRLNHRNQLFESPNRPSSRSSNIKEAKKPLHVSRKKLPAKPEIDELKTSKSNHAITKSKTRVTETTVRTNGQKSGVTNYDAQIGSSRRSTVKKRSTEGETSSSSSSRGKKVSEASSVRTRRSVNINGDNQSMVQSTGVTPHEPSSDHGLSNMMTGGYNVNAIANVLLALERIDQDEGLTYEQILSLDGNSFLGGLSFNLYDQHRDMRLDIDNMSYEELLALEDKMGIVSTALSEEELLKCVKISKYEPFQIRESKTETSCNLDDTKCSICQEEYIAGVEIGKMGCNHGYHADCINHWLRLKNWCPVCKTSAKP